MNPEYQTICDRILADNRDFVGVSYRKLDCGCMQFCGLSASGQMLGCRYHLSGQPPTRNLEPLVCLKCRKDAHFAVERTVEKGIVWAADPPGPEAQEQIRRTLWGTDETE